MLLYNDYSTLFWIQMVMISPFSDNIECERPGLAWPDAIAYIKHASYTATLGRIPVMSRMRIGSYMRRLGTCIFE